MTATILVNGEPARHRPGLTVTELLESRGLQSMSVAVALNGAVVHREEWAGTVVPSGGEVEILTPMQGG
ncbi:sulfur carrier protein ThiS [Luteipulveratus mongoliensis]|uniref:Thiamine biosynthesis protein ThiS n=1 Tax=Luteipulveratus mongoliensis TaxID=571913 RepID=A0A0K1JKA6_9MICO|nr:sulfur carrier protein ThiS [Luteipulveratus mongoliensis]AKU17010.1 hypothetical protein VV02_15990 [Luteipulveratus mongoliensis]